MGWKIDLTSGNGVGASSMAAVRELWAEFLKEHRVWVDSGGEAHDKIREIFCPLTTYPLC